MQDFKTKDVRHFKRFPLTFFLNTDAYTWHNWYITLVAISIGEYRGKKVRCRFHRYQVFHATNQIYCLNQVSIYFLNIWHFGRQKISSELVAYFNHKVCKYFILQNADDVTDTCLFLQLYLLVWQAGSMIFSITLIGK